MQHENGLEGNASLLRSVRAGLTLKGMSLRGWCAANHMDPSHVHRVLKGTKNGPAAERIRQTLIQESREAA